MKIELENWYKPIVDKKQLKELSKRKNLPSLIHFSIYFGSYDLARISQRHTHQSNIDLRVGSIVAHANSLPPANRKHIK